MGNLDQIKKVMSNETDLSVHIDNIYKLTEKQTEIKSFYKEQIHFLKAEYRNKKLTQEELQEKIAETKKVYLEYNAKIKEILDLNYSVSIWEYQQSEVLKEKINYPELKQEYISKLDKVKSNKEELKTVKKDYQVLKKTLKPKYIAIIAITSTLALLLAALLVNYLYYFKVANNGASFSFSDKNHVVAFVFMCIGILLVVGFLAFVVLNVSKRIFLDKEENLFKTSSIGFVGSFMDTIGVGSFAITVAGLNATNTIKNVKNLPGTLNIGLTIPNLLAGTLFVSAIQVELVTLITLVIAAMVGAFAAAKLVNKVNKKFVALFVSICLSVAGILMILAQAKIFNTAGTNGLTGWRLAVGIIGFFIIGGLQSFGVGLYAPALAIVSLLGMETIVAFPIMTCAGGFALPTTAWTFHRDNNYNPKVSYGLLIGGVFGTVAAFFIIFVGIQGGGGVDMADFTYWLKWFAVAVMYYASFMLLKKYLGLRKSSQNEAKKTIENYYQQYEQDFLKMFEKKLVDISEVKAFEQEIFQEKISTNNIQYWSGTSWINKVSLLSKETFLI